MGQYASLFDEDGAKAALNLRFGFDAKPDDVARDAALAKRFGLPQGVIAEYRPDYETRAKVEDARQMLDEAPKLRGWLAADIKRAELAHDDIGSLTAIEKATRFLGNAGKALASGVPMFSAGAYAGAAAPFGVADQIIQSLDDAAAFLTGTPRRQIVGAPGPESFLLNEARAAKQSAQRLMPDTAGMGPEERGFYSGLQSAGQNMTTLPLGFIAAGGEALMLAAMGITTGGLSYLKGRDAGADPAKSAVFGAADAVAEIVTERYMGAAGLLRNVKAGASTGKLIAYELAKELPGEVTATLWQNFNEWTILNPEKSLADFVLEQPDAIRETIVATLVGGGVQIGAIKGVERTIRMADRQDTKAAEAGTKAMALGELSKLVEAGKLRTRDVETFQELARELTDEGVPSIYIDAQTLNQSGIDLQAVAQAMPSVAAQVERAIATGGDLVIPTPEFLAAVPGQQFAAELIDLARTAPDAMSAAEAKRYMDERGDQLQAEIAKVLDERQQDDAFQTSREDVRRYFTDQLNATKRFTPDVNGAYASMLADFYSAQASRLGMAPADLLDRYRLRAAAQTVGGARVMEQGASSIDDVRAEWDAAGIDGMMTERDGMIRLSRIVVPDGERGAGRGTAAMQALIRYADATGQSIALSPSTDFGATSRARLVKFYKRFGFIENKGRNRAFTVSDAMYRPASGAVLEQPANGQGAAQTETPEFKRLSALLGPAGMPDLVQALRDQTVVDGLQRNAKALADLLESQSSFSERDSLVDIPSPVVRHVLGATNNKDVRRAVVAALPVDVVNLLARKQLTADQLLRDKAVLENVLSVDGAADVSLAIDKASATSLLRSVASQAAELARLADGLLKGDAAGLTNAGDSVIRTHAKSVTETEAFSRWFGDSKVVDANGKPLVVYHGTTADIAAFDSTRLGENTGAESATMGFFFADDTVTAESYANYAATDARIAALVREAEKAEAANDWDTYDAKVAEYEALDASFSDPQNRMAGQNVLPIYLSLQNPLRVDAKGENAVGFDISAAVKKAIRGKYDGLIIDNLDDAAGIADRPATHFVAFKPTQIKSAIGNSGAFDPANPSILEQPAYHGTPHRGIDKFSTDNIGTGEGAQAYGWGLYFASKREIAEWYRENLTTHTTTIDGKPVDPSMPRYAAIMSIAAQGYNKALADAESALASGFVMREAGEKAVEDIKALKGAKIKQTKAKGQLYAVELPDDEHLLLWDKPLSEQPAAVREALAGKVDDSNRVEQDGADFYVVNDTGRSEFYKTREAADAAAARYNDKTGSQAYRSLTDAFGSDKAASEALAAAGIKGIKYLDGTSRGAGEGSYNYVVFSGDDVAITQQFYQGGQQARAQIAFPQDITQAPSVITLLQGADLSSFIHETGHFFLEVQADLAARIHAQARGGASLTDGERQILADTNTLLDWFGIKGNEQQDALTEWLSMGMEQRREHHEKFARGFEAYAMEGKAPSVELRAIFSRFRAWLVSVYKNLKALNVTLTDDVRAVMDRMLATDEQIADMQAARGMSALFKTAEEAGMTPDEWRAYNDLAAEAVGQAAEYLDARSLRDLKWAQNAKSRAIKDLQKQADAIRRETRLRVRAEVMAQPVYRAWQFLTTKDSAAVDDGPSEVEKAYRADLADWEQRRKEFVEEATKDERARLWAAAPESKETGVTPLMKGQFISRNKRLIAANVEVEAIAWELDNPKPVKPEPRQPQQTGPLEEGAGKLSTSALKEMYGNKPDALWRKLSARRMTSDTIGISPDVVAEAFGFDSGDAMVKALADAVPPAEVVEAMTDERMLAENGELATPEAIERAADEAVHNEARARFVATEFSALEKANAVREKVPGTRRTVDVLARAAREYAATVVAAMKVRELTAGRFEAAEARAARNAEKAMRSGDMAKAAAEKRAQMIQSAAAKATLDARREMDQARAYFRRFDKRRTSIDPDYQDQIDALLERVELRQISDKASARRKSLAAWVEDQRAQGNDPDIPDKLLQESALTSFRDMTVEEVRGLRDTIRQIEHLGRLKNRLLTAREQRDFDAAADEVSQSIVDNGGAARPVVLEGADRGFKPWLEGFAASHRKLSSLIRQMDGGRDDGPLWRFLGRAMNERGTMEDVMTERATVALDAIYAPVMALPGGVNGGKVFIPEIGASLSRGGRLSVLLNWGNEDNRQRIRDGDKWTDAQVLAIIKTLSPAELEFANKVWEFIDGYWPEVAAKQRRVTGVEPEKVQAVPFTATASDGTEVQMRGGYYPLKYDAARSDRAGQQEAAQVYKEMIQGAYTKAQTRKGHTKERLQEVKRPVRKDLNVITQHVSQVVHDLAWHEWLLDANKLIGDERISEAIREHYGPAVLKTIRENLQGIATADVVPQTDIDKALLMARSNITRATMGASLTTAFLQPFGLTQSMVRIGPKHVLRGVARWGGDAARLESTIGWINGKSDFMRLRAKTFNRELREISQQVHGKSKVMRAVDSGLFALTQKMQLVADVPTWVGQYEKTMAEGPAADTDEARAALEAKAIADADRAVIESQGSGQPKDLADVQRKHPMLTQFYSYFSVTLNLTAERTAATDFKNPRAVAGWLGDMALLLVIPALVPAMLMDAMRGGDDDDDESYALKLAKWQAGYLLGMVVGVRELSGIVGGFDYAGPPVARIGVDIGKAAQQTAQGEVDEALVLSYARLMGDAFGIPVTQAIRSYKGWKAWDEGEEGAGPQSVLFGPPLKD